MSRKLFGLLIAILLIASGELCFAEAPASQNIILLSGSGGAEGITPPVTALRVRYGSEYPNDTSIASGDVVVWDVNSADGITISKCIVDNAVSYAGVAITSIATSDNSNVRGSDRNWGSIAIKGYCLAKVDTSESTTGHPLITNGATVEGSFGTADLLGGTVGLISKDIGVLLTDTASDGLMRVYLK